MTEDEIRTRLLDLCCAIGSQTAWAKENGISVSYVNDVIQGRRAPAGRLLAAMGLERVVTYRRIKQAPIPADQDGDEADNEWDRLHEAWSR